MTQQWPGQRPQQPGPPQGWHGQYGEQRPPAPTPQQPGVFGGQSQPGRGPQQPLPDGRQPLGQQPPSHVDISQFQTPRSRFPRWLWALIAVLAAALVAWGAIAALTPSGSPTPTSSTSSRHEEPSSTRSVSPRGSLWQDQSGSVSGYWEVLEEAWDANGLTVKLLMECDKGSTSMQFFVFSKDQAANQYQAERRSTMEPNLNGGTLKEGESRTGYVTIDMPRGPATLIFGARASKPYSGLDIEG